VFLVVAMAISGIWPSLIRQLAFRKGLQGNSRNGTFSFGFS